MGSTVLILEVKRNKTILSKTRAPKTSLYIFQNCFSVPNDFKKCKYGSKYQGQRK